MNKNETDFSKIEQRELSGARYVAYTSRLKTWQFWRAMIVCFCAFSLIGHLCEWVYCYFGAVFFNSISMDAEVLTNPFKPFFVYGIGFIVCAVVLDPIKLFMIDKLGNKKKALGVFYIMGVFLGMAGELIQGFLQNQPVDGVYPLWDVSNYPGNILGQAWIVNDILLGALITFIVWVVYPLVDTQIGKLEDRVANIHCAVVAAAFLVLVVVTYFII